MNEYKEKSIAGKLMIFSIIWIIGVSLIIILLYRLHIYFLARIVSILGIFNPIAWTLLIVGFIMWIVSKFSENKDIDSINTQVVNQEKVIINKSENSTDEEIDENDPNAEMMKEIKKLREEVKKQSEVPIYEYRDFKKAMSWSGIVIFMCLLEIIPIINWFLFPIALIVLIIIFAKGTIIYPTADMVSNHNFIRILLILTLIPVIGWWCDIVAIISVLSLRGKVKRYYYNQKRA